MQIKSLLPLFSILLYLTSCMSNNIDLRSQRWSTYFSNTEKERILFVRAEDHYERGKKYLNLKLLKRAQSEFQFLYFEFSNKKAEQIHGEINRFIVDQFNEYKNLAKQTKNKNLVFTTAGYYRNALRLSPADKESKDYLNKNKSEIVKRLDTNLKYGYNYINNDEFGKAKRCFNRILIFDPDNSKAQYGINLIKKKKELIAAQSKIKLRKTSNQREINKIKRALENDIREKIEEKLSLEYEAKFAAKIDEAINQIEEKEEVKNEPVVIVKEPEIKIKQLDDKEKEQFYQTAVTAYDEKDYLKAYDYFEAINDSSFKDTSLYLKRTEDKINTLGLNEDD
jgi:tetratricopeptide (TPR) repeat protein